MDVNTPDNNNQSASVPMGGIIKGEASAPDFKSMIPETYRDKEYLKNIDSFDGLFQQFDNAQSLIGRKTVGVPSETSPKEEWESFYNKMGRPESYDKYEFEKIQDAPENFTRPPEKEEVLKKTFHELGLTAQQAKELLKRSDMYEIEAYKEHQKMVEAETAKANAEFAQQLDSLFGAKKSEKVELTNQLLQKYTPEGLKGHLTAIDDKTMLVLASVLTRLHDSEVREDNGFNRGEPTPAKDSNALQEEARRLMMSSEFKDWQHPNHSNTKAKVQSLYQQINLLKSRK